MAVPNGREHELICRTAYERALLELLRESAAEEERLHREIRGDAPRFEVREVILVGEYPHTAFQFSVYDHVREAERPIPLLLYENPQFYDSKGKRLVDADRIVGDMLMWVRGG